MRGPEHVAVAIVTTGGALYLLNHGQMPTTLPALAPLAVAAVASLIPDIDHPNAWISNRIPWSLISLGVVPLVIYAVAAWSVARSGAKDLGAIMMAPAVPMLRPLLGWAWLLVGLGVAIVAISVVVRVVSEHRGPTHSLTVGASLTLVSFVGFAIARLPITLGLAFGWGYLSHLLADLITPMGCPALLWPVGTGGLARWRTAKPAFVPMTRPGVQESETPSQITSAAADGDSGLAQPVEDPQSYVATGFAQDVLAPPDSEAGKQPIN